MTGKRKSSYFPQMLSTFAAWFFPVLKNRLKNSRLEVRKLLQDAPGFEWSRTQIRMAYQEYSESLALGRR